ncbi:hypothetical protein ACET3X_005545 [Alternaria dauci]|uniref:Uncharacterized protein n=1 Tax=Alternaria dauci TaxID=48095 RepID=A0ABR3UKZ3_9PLEO
MARYFEFLLFVWCLFLVTVIRADQPVSFSHGFLYGRQAGDSDSSNPGLQCTRFCEVSGGGSPGPRGFVRRSNSPCGSPPVSRRNVHQPLFVELDGIDGHGNITEKKFVKRAFEEIGDNAAAATYVIRTLIEGPENERPAGFFHLDENTGRGSPAAVQYMERFGDQPFKLGTSGLHGCTMVTIVSKRAVYMAHFWETYSTHGEDTVTGVSRQQFLERVNNAVVKGTAVANPYNPPESRDSSDRIARNHKYVKPEGPPIDFSLFNEDGDNSVMYVMTPLKDNKSEDSKIPEDCMYYKKYARLLFQEVSKRTNIRGLRLVMVPYKRLHYNIDENGNSVRAPGYDDDWDEFVQPTHAKGMALFEYDGERNWRLFYENKYFPEPEE